MNKLSQVDLGQTFGSRFTGGTGLGISDVVKLALQGAFTLSGLLILILFLVAGFYIIKGAGEENPEQAAKGKKAATSALIGFLIVFCAYWVIRLIEIIAGINFITNPTI